LCALHLLHLFHLFHFFTPANPSIFEYRRITFWHSVFLSSGPEYSLSTTFFAIWALKWAAYMSVSLWGKVAELQSIQLPRLPPRGICNTPTTVIGLVIDTLAIDRIRCLVVHARPVINDDSMFEIRSFHGVGWTSSITFQLCKYTETFMASFV
jgi:hypothetical protein